jgi:hypothetical protein
MPPACDPAATARLRGGNTRLSTMDPARVTDSVFASSAIGRDAVGATAGVCDDPGLSRLQQLGRFAPVCRDAVWLLGVCRDVLPPLVVMVPM